MRIFILIISFLVGLHSLAQDRHYLTLNITDDLSIPQDSVKADILWNRGKHEFLFSKSGKIRIELQKNDSILVKLSRGDDFYATNCTFRYYATEISEVELEKTIPLYPLESIGHGFSELNLTDLYSETDILDFPDTISFYNNSKLLNQRNTEYLMIDSLSPDEYSFKLIMPETKVIKQESKYNQRLRVELRPDDIVFLNLDTSSEKYYATWYGTYRESEIRLIKLK